MYRIKGEREKGRERWMEAEGGREYTGSKGGEEGRKEMMGGWMCEGEWRCRQGGRKMCYGGVERRERRKEKGETGEEKDVDKDGWRKNTDNSNWQVCVSVFKWKVLSPKVKACAVVKDLCAARVCVCVYVCRVSANTCWIKQSLVQPQYPLATEATAVSLQMWGKENKHFSLSMLTVFHCRAWMYESGSCVKPAARTTKNCSSASVVLRE